MLEWLLPCPVWSEEDTRQVESCPTITIIIREKNKWGVRVTRASLTGAGQNTLSVSPGVKMKCSLSDLLRPQSNV